MRYYRQIELYARKQKRLRRRLALPNALLIAHSPSFQRSLRVLCGDCVGIFVPSPPPDEPLCNCISIPDTHPMLINERPVKILILGEAKITHTQRWIAYFQNAGWTVRAL